MAVSRLRVIGSGKKSRQLYDRDLTIYYFLHPAGCWYVFTHCQRCIPNNGGQWASGYPQRQEKTPSVWIKIKK
jgi:hypothetical protein